MKILIVFMFVALHATAQDTIPLNSSDSIKGHSVKRAVLLSTALPGAGQVYNHIAMPKGKKNAYWKVPLIYAGLGASSYFLISNQQNQKELKNEYTLRQDTGLSSDKWAAYDDQGILTLYNQYLDWRDLSILALAGVYVLQIVDAGVEAHFVNFDISEDLSLSIEPTMMQNYTGGLKLRLKFR